jgi:hypothetical protein
MHPSRLASLLVHLTAAGLFLVSGCTTGVREEPPSAESRLQTQAQTLEAAGDFKGAAAVYLQAAEQAAAPLKEDYLLRSR